MKDTGIIAILLAAGKSSRMKVNKLALPLGGTTIGSLALHNAINSDLAHILVVTKEEDVLHWIDTGLWQPQQKKRWTSVSCRDAEKGQAHSLRCGLIAAKEMDPKGVMVLLADQPFLSVTLINDLILKFKADCMEGRIIPFLAASYQGIPRPPILFTPYSFPELLELKGDEGARKLIQKQKLAGKLVEFENAWDFLDIDTREEYEKLIGGGRHYDSKGSGDG